MSSPWHPGKYLPHFDHPGLIQLVTFRLVDSMPAARRAEWESFMHLEKSISARNQIQAYLDRGYGESWLALPHIARIVEDELRRGDGEAYRLFEWVIMPNHVHVLIEQTQVGSLPTIVRQWKGASARYANLALGRSGPFWFRDYFDRFIRDQSHFEAAVSYIHENPVRAGLVKHARDFPYGSARYVITDASHDG